VFFKLIKVYLLVSELYIYQNARCNDKNLHILSYFNTKYNNLRNSRRNICIKKESNEGNFNLP